MNRPLSVAYPPLSSSSAVGVDPPSLWRQGSLLMGVTGAYVATFAVAADGCWFDLAAGVGASAVLGWALFSVALAVTNVRHVGGGCWLALCLASARPGAAVLFAAALVNVSLYLATGTGTVHSKVAAFLFLPFHAGLLLLAHLFVGAAFITELRSAGHSRRRAAAMYAAVTGLCLGAFTLLHHAGAF